MEAPVREGDVRAGKYRVANIAATSDGVTLYVGTSLGLYESTTGGL